ncbi:MAG: acyltransferase [Proteobacteria bacterium]|nr:acyltransferase [Pseudomonadota bacterium]
MQSDHNTSKLLYLNGLRGIAALIVVSTHLVTTFYPAVYYGDFSRAHNSWESIVAFKFPFTLIYAGNFSVCIFFVLSGYVLTYSYQSRSNKPNILALFIRRYIRLTIPILFTSFIAYLFLKNNLFYHQKIIGVSGAKELSEIYAFQPGIYSMFKEALLTLYTSDSNKYNVVLWTMKVELIGSYMVYIVLRIFSKIKLRILICLLLTFIVPNYYFCFVFGVLLYDFNEAYGSIVKFKGSLHKICNIGLMVCAMFLAAAPFCYLPLPINLMPLPEAYKIFYLILLRFSDVPVVVAHEWGAIITIVLLQNSPILQSFLSGKLFQFLGKISFPMYLLHKIIILSFMSYVFNLFVLSKYEYSYDFVFMVSAVLSLLLIIVVSYFIEYFVDQPGIKISKYAEDKVRSLQKALLELR